jgi:hypothetical protein
MRKTIIIILLLSFCLGLSLEAKNSAAKQLQTNLEQWSQFRWEGIIQVQMSAFSARKNFILSKNRDEMRLDVLDSGVMGLQAKPLATIYLKDKILVEAPTIKQLQDVDLNWFVPQGAVSSLVHFADSLLANIQTILKDRKLTTANTAYAFDKKHRLIKITSPELGMKAEIIYNRRNQPTKLLLDHDGDRIVELQINEQKYNKVRVIPLIDPKAIPEPEPEISEIPQMEGRFYTLDLSDPEIAALLDSLDLRDLKLGIILDSLKLSDLKLEDLNLKDFGLDSLKLQELDLKGFKLDGLSLKDLGLDSLKLDSLKLDLKQLKNMNLDQLLDKLELKDMRLGDLLKDLHLEDIKLDDLLKDMDLKELNLDALGIEPE